MDNGDPRRAQLEKERTKERKNERELVRWRRREKEVTLISRGELAVNECILERRCKGGSEPLASARPISAEVSKTPRYIANRTLLHARGIDAALHSLAQYRYIFHACFGHGSGAGWSPRQAQGTRGHGPSWSMMRPLVFGTQLRQRITRKDLGG